jgi:hypothetical protein
MEWANADLDNDPLGCGIRASVSMTTHIMNNRIQLQSKWVYGGDARLREVVQLPPYRLKDDI